MSEHSTEKIQQEQVTILCQRTGIIAGGSLLVAAILVYVLSVWFPVDWLLIWAAAVVIVSVARIIVQQLFLPDLSKSQSAQTRIAVLTFFSGVSGCVWGALGFVFVDINYPIASILVVMVLTGMVASATAAQSVVLPVFLAFMIPAFGPAVFRFASFNQEVSRSIAVLIVVFMLSSFYFALGNNRSIRASIKLRFDNLDLIEDLSVEKQRADDARIKAEAANLAKSKFLAAASHDLRQPMHALRLFTTELQERTQAAEYRDLVEKISRSVEALEGLFNALLDISKLDAGTVGVEKNHFRLQPILKRLENDYMDQAKSKGLTFVIPESELTLYSDPTLIERILRNLISNALRYTDRGNVSLYIVNDEDQVTIQIQDTGIGIDSSEQEKIFEEFTQLHNPQRDRSQGLGLGLSIVKRIAALLDHPLRLDSKLKEGSTFSIKVPKGDEHAIMDQPITSQNEFDCSDLFVLIIEDEPAVREGLCRLLTHWRCVTLEAASLQEALNKLVDYEFAPDVILSDFRLPDHITGIEAIAQIRNRYEAEIPALIMTGDTAAERLKETHASAIPLIHKPFEPIQVKAFLSSIRNQLKLEEKRILDEGG